MYNSSRFGKNITEVRKVKEKVNQMFKDKLFLVMLVLGLLTIVAAAGVVTIQRGNQQGEENPYMEIQEPGGYIAEETAPQQTQVAGNSNAVLPTDAVEEDTSVQETRGLAEGTIDEPIAQVGAGKDAATPLVLNFTDASKMTWPVFGNVLLDYNMESTIYFPTLDQYKCNPAVIIQGDVSDPVSAPANARVQEVGSNEEIGNYVVLDLGNDYSVTCGQLKDIKVVENEYMEQGQIIGYVSEPTKYYSVEGTNLFLEMKHQDQTVDPLDYLQ